MTAGVLDWRRTSSLRHLIGGLPVGQQGVGDEFCSTSVNAIMAKVLTAAGVPQFYRSRFVGASCTNAYECNGPVVSAHWLLVSHSPRARLIITNNSSGTNLLAWLACYLLVPDTANKDLEDIALRRKQFYCV
jgi:hypothetical protein